MKLSRLFLGLVLSSGLAIIVSACGSSDSDDNGNSPFGGGGSGGTSSTGSTGGTSTTGNWVCAEVPVTCKSGSISACCDKAGTQCKYVVGGKDYPCDGTDCEATAESVVSACF